MARIFFTAIVFFSLLGLAPRPALAQQDLVLSKQFIGTAEPGGTVTLRFTITNPNPDIADAIAFTDTLPAVPTSQLSATALPAANVCGGGSQIAGTTSLAFTGGFLAAQTSCTFEVALKIPDNAQSGTFTNTTSTITSLISDDLVANTGPAATATLTIEAEVPAGSITIVKHTMGYDDTFRFDGSGMIGMFELTTDGGTAQTSFADLTPGTYTVTEIANENNGDVTSLTCEDPDDGSSTNLSTATATIDLDDGETVTCTFMNVRVEEMTEAVVTTVLHRHNALILDAAPDRVHFFRRFPQAFWSSSQEGSASSYAPSASLGLRGDSGRPAASFASGLNQVAAAHRAAQGRKLEGTGSALALQHDGAGGLASGPPRFDVWTEARYQYFVDDAGGLDRHGHFAVVYLGADYLLSPDWMAGVLVQGDYLYDRSEAVLFSETEGFGWMAGPYVSGRFAGNLFVMLRGAWGRGHYNIAPFGTYSDDIDTDRWLVDGSLTGNWASGPFRISPNVRVRYIEQNLGSYTDSNGVAIDGQSVALGRLSAGPELGYRAAASTGSVIELQGSASLVWDFKKPHRIAAGNAPFSPDDLYLQLKGAAALLLPSGVRLRAETDYTGLFTDHYGAIGGRLWLSVPLAQ